MAGKGSPTWQRRNARAQALGYESYYDYRAHGYGKRPASEPRARGPELARLRGHRGGAELDRRVRGGDVELMNVIQTNADPPEFEVLVTRSDGSTETYTVKGQKAIDRMNATIRKMGPDAPQIVGSPAGRRQAERLEAAIAAEQEARADEDELDDDELDDEDVGDDDIPF